VKKSCAGVVLGVASDGGGIPRSPADFKVVTNLYVLAEMAPQAVGGGGLGFRGGW